MAELDGIMAKVQDLELRLVRLEVEWAMRRQRETNMPGWIWAAVSAITAALSFVFWWIMEWRHP
jgi:hypothetical protein